MIIPKKSNRYAVIFFVCLLSILSLLKIELFGQIKEGQTLDKIVAIVGNEIIMMSDIQSQMALYAQQNPNVNLKDTELQKTILDNLINEKLVLTKAREDSITVSDEEVDQRWDYHLKNLIQYYGSEKRVEDIYGISITRLQYEYRDLIRNQILIEKIQQEKIAKIKATPREAEEFFKDYKDSLGKLPEQVELYHIVKYVEATTKAKDETYAYALRVRDSILKGGDFADFAKRYSADRNSAIRGGELGWIKKGLLFPEFEKAAFEMAPGGISMPVETPYGYHIIQTMDKKKDSLLTRHILLKIGQSDDDINRIKNFLLSLIDSVKQGKDFESLAKIYSDENETKGFGGSMGIFEIEKIPANIKDYIIKLSDGDITNPLPYSNDPTKSAFHIVYKKKTIPSHFPTFENDFKYIEQRATFFKQMKVMQEWIESLRKTIYWEIKE